MSNKNQAKNAIPRAPAVQNGAFFLSTLGETTELLVDTAGVWPPDFETKFEAVFVGTDKKWDSGYTSKGGLHVQLPVGEMRPHIHREVEIRFYVKSEGVEHPTDPLTVRILP
jgi:hypothetical protein